MSRVENMGRVVWLTFLIGVSGALVSCAEERTHLSLEISADVDVGPIDRIEAWAKTGTESDAKLSERFGQDLAGRDLHQDPVLIGLQVSEGSSFGGSAQVVVLGVRAGAIVASAVLKEDLQAKSLLSVKLVLIKGGCDADGDGFQDCAKADCCTHSEDEGFADCDDGNGQAHPFAASASCRACEASCGGGVADVEVVEQESEVIDEGDTSEDGGVNDIDSVDSKQDVHLETMQFVDNDDGTITDTKTILIWQKTPNSGIYRMCSDPNQSSYDFDFTQCPAQYHEAENHCEDNEDALPGSGWRLPTISELRSLVKGCDFTYWDPTTNTGGACGVTDDCLASSCVEVSPASGGSWGPCTGCLFGEGMGEGFRYIDRIFENSEHEQSWSSSLCEDFPVHAWNIFFGRGWVDHEGVDAAMGVRCVRSGP